MRINKTSENKVKYYFLLFLFRKKNSRPEVVPEEGLGRVRHLSGHSGSRSHSSQEGLLFAGLGLFHGVRPDEVSYSFVPTLFIQTKLEDNTLNQLINYSGTIMLNFQFVIARVKFLLIFEMCYLSIAHECIRGGHSM